MRSPWSPGLNDCGAQACRKCRVCEGPFRAGRVLPHPRRSSHHALDPAEMLMASLSPRQSQSLHRTPRKIPGDLKLLKLPCSK